MLAKDMWCPCAREGAGDGRTWSHEDAVVQWPGHHRPASCTWQPGTRGDVVDGIDGHGGAQRDGTVQRAQHARAATLLENRVARTGPVRDGRKQALGQVCRHDGPQLLESASAAHVVDDTGTPQVVEGPLAPSTHRRARLAAGLDAGNVGGGGRRVSLVEGEQNGKAHAQKVCNEPVHVPRTPSGHLE